MLEGSWYPIDSSGNRSGILEAAFIGEVSLLRTSLVNERDVDSYRNGKFVNYGIVELDADEIVGRTNCSFRIVPDVDWPTDAHAIIIRQSGGKNLRATHAEVSIITAIANSSRIVRLPRP